VLFSIVLVLLNERQEVLKGIVIGEGKIYLRDFLGNNEFLLKKLLKFGKKSIETPKLFNRKSLKITRQLQWLPILPYQRI
jgi:hypothetical protein